MTRALFAEGCNRKWKSAKIGLRNKILSGSSGNFPKRAPILSVSRDRKQFLIKKPAFPLWGHAGFIAIKKEFFNLLTRHYFASRN